MATRDSQHAGKDKEQKGKESARSRRMSPWMYLFSVSILVIIVVTFIGGPLLTGTGGGGGISFGSFAGDEIRYIPGNYLSRQKDAIAERVSDSGTNTNLEWVAYQVWRGAFQNTVIHTAILEQAEKSGLSIAEETIDQALTSYGGYIENGEFSASRYRETPNAEKASIRKYYREEIIHNQYMQDILSAVKVSDATMEFIKGMAGPERSFFYLRIGFEAFPAELVGSYALENADLFRKINVSRITVKSSEENAQSVLQQVSADPALFEEVARTQSKDAYAEAGGYIGNQYFFSLSAELESEEEAAAIFALSADGISSILSTPFGWVIYKINEAAVPVDPADEEDVATVRSYMERFERGTIEDYLIAEGESLKNELANEGLANVDVPAWESGQTASFPINYGNVEFLKPVQDTASSGALESAAFNESLLTSLFSLEPETVSEPQILGDQVYLFEVNEIIPTDPDTLETVGLYYSYLIQQYAESDLRTAILSSDRLEDNFDAVFTKYFLSN